MCQDDHDYVYDHLHDHPSFHDREFFDDYFNVHHYNTTIVPL